jgi:uncharacterized protein YgfB (UPF0149 family)
MQPDYSLMRQLLAAAVPELSPASLHGALTGYLCSGAEPDPEIFSDLFETPLPAVVLRLLERLGTEAREVLQQTDYSFQPLLPEDDSNLVERLTALGEWCDWFNIGFSAGYMQPQLPLSVEVMEILNDFGQLADVDVPNAGGEDDENYFMELVEYVRMAAITVFQQMQEAEPGLAADDNDEPGQHFADPDNDQLLH